MRPPKPAPEIDRAPVPEALTPPTPQIVQQTPPEPAPSLPPEPKVTPPQPDSDGAIATAPAPRKQRNLTPSLDAQVVSFVNAELSRTWKETGVKPTPPATDAEWCQRLFVRLLGRAPTADEQKSLAADNAKTRREKLVEEDGEVERILLGDDVDAQSFCHVRSTSTRAHVTDAQPK